MVMCCVFDYGVFGFIFKFVDLDIIGYVLGIIFDGEIWVLLEVYNVLFIECEECEIGQCLCEFILQQFCVLQMFGVGWFNKQIVYDFNVFEVMIKVYVIVILCKLGVINCMQVVLMVGKLVIDEELIVLLLEED